ncbi:amino acid permease [Bifidobacterium choloepi]|uniref:amino acid permease n=1 Tax=Bifidobacterium choloepi TaxID=2614131 RepID=UPI001E316ED0|nr:amino acid permease [Bifidobacterium choloepi]
MKSEQNIGKQTANAASRAAAWRGTAADQTGPGRSTGLWWHSQDTDNTSSNDSSNTSSSAASAQSAIDAEDAVVDTPANVAPAVDAGHPSAEESFNHAAHDGDEAPTLKRSLKNRHIQLIALGGAIGTGLFYGSSESISLAGPSILLAYIVGGLAIFMIVRALSEMSVEDPRAGAFSFYATRYWSKRAGFVSGWNYWFNYILVSMVELSVVGSFVNYWFPNIPQWVSAAFFLVLITIFNLLGVSKFGEFEFWFALIKIVAVIAMIVGGAAVIVMNLPTDSGIRASFANWFDVGGGFLPNGIMQRSADGQWTGLLMALVVVMFSFGGTELIGITAGETENPKTTIPKATNGIIWRILVFYVAALGIIMAVVPWNTIDGTMSPFVQIFDSVGVKVAAGILNFVCLTAVMSVYNSGLYSNSRMLYSLAKQKNAPAYLGKINFRGVPVAGVLTSAAITVLAVVVVFLWPEFAFNYLMSIATIAGIINWTMILITEHKFRKAVARGEGPNELAGLTGKAALDKIQFKLPGAPVMEWVVIAFMALVVVLMLFSASYRIAVIAGVIWLAVLLVAYEIVEKVRLRNAGRDQLRLPVAMPEKTEEE